MFRCPRRMVAVFTLALLWGGTASAASERIVALSGNGKVMVTLENERRIRVLNTDSGKLVRRWEIKTRSIPALGLSCDGALLAVYGDGGADKKKTIQVFDTSTGRRCWERESGKAVLFAAFTADGSILAFGGIGNVIELAEATTGRRLGQLTGHRDRVVAGAFSHDGKTLISASADHTVRVWDVAARRERHRLKGHGGGATVSHIAFSADGDRVVTGGDDGRICVWDVRTGRRLRFWTNDDYGGATNPALPPDDPTDTYARVAALALSPDGRTIVADRGPDTFCLWDAASGTASPLIHGHREAVVSAAFRADGRTVVTASRDGTALVWDVAALRRRKLPPPAPVRNDFYGDPLPPDVLARMGSTRLRHEEDIVTAAFSPDGKILAAASDGGGGHSLRLWDTKTGKELRRLSGERTPPFVRLAFSPDGKLLAGLSGSRVSTVGSNGVYLWDVASGASLGVAVRQKGGITAFAFSPDGTKIAAASGWWDDGKNVVIEIYLWDLASGERLRAFDGHPNLVHQLAFTADGTTLFSASDTANQPADEQTKPGAMSVWDLATGKLRNRYNAEVHSLAANGRTFVFHDDNSPFHVCDAATGRQLWSTPDERFASTYSPDGKLLFLYRDDSQRLVDAATGKEIRRSTTAIDTAGTQLYLSPRGATVATTTWWNYEIRLWDMATGRERRPFSRHELGVVCASFAPDGRTMASGSVDSTVRLWDTATGKELWRSREPILLTPCGMAWGMRAVAFSPDGRTLIAAHALGSIDLWDIATRKLRRGFETHAGLIVSLAISPDNKLLALVIAMEGPPDRRSVRCEVCAWNLTTGRELGKPLSWKSNSLDSAVFSPDGKLVVAHCRIEHSLQRKDDTGEFRFWEVATGKEIRRLAIPKPARHMAVSPYGTALFSDGVLRDAATGEVIRNEEGHWESASLLAFSPDGRTVASTDGDCLIFLQPAPQPLPRTARPPRPLSARQLQTLWADLAAPDPAQAWRAVHHLIASPKTSVPFLRTVLQPALPLDPHLKRLLADLDSDRFPVRERARSELSKLGELAEPALRHALTGKPSLEVRRQVLMLQEKRENEAPSLDALRILRVTTVLERIGTAESAELLRRLARGVAEARLTRESAAALERLTRSGLARGVGLR